MAKAVATAASTAPPPSLSTSAPTCEAMAFPETTSPFLVRTGCDVVPKWPDQTSVTIAARPISRRIASRAKGILERGARRREQLGAIFGDDHVVLEPNAELPANVDARFVAEGHARRQLQRVAPHEIRPFVAIHPEAMADAVGEVLVVGAESRVDDHCSRGRVDRLALDAGSCRFERRILRAPIDLEHALHTIARLAQHKRAAEIRLVSFDRAAAVDEQDRALTD